MKTLITPAVALLAMLAAAPVIAQNVAPGGAAAIAHFNGDADSQDDRIASPRGTVASSTLSLRSGNLADAYARFNADADSPNERMGLAGATRIGGAPSYGADVFRSLRAE